jgi:DNA-binding transcriptional ArsR family regulator
MLKALCKHQRMGVSSPERYERVGDLFRILASPARLAIVDLLSKEECFVHQLVEATGLSQPNVSQHLRILREAGLVRRARRGRQTVYALRDDHVAHIIKDAIAHSREALP